MEERGSRISLDPINRVFVVENHDQAYHIWREAGAKRRILVHIDAHHDMWWIPDSDSLTIANFICPALKDEIVREIFWIVPDATWDSQRSRRPVLRHLKQITKKYPDALRTCRVESGQISTAVLGKPLRVCPLGSLPRIDERVLLDIDVDFLMIPRVSFDESDRHGALPWCWPEDLVARLGASDIRSDLVTISYSVEGGYTPLTWKYLGDELALRLKQPDHIGPRIEGMQLIREAAVAADRGDLVVAEERYRKAGDLLPTSPAPSYHLAHLCVEMGRIAEGREYYRRALALDPSYRTAYNSAGIWYHSDRRFRKAEREHRRVLTLDPQDAYALFGLGRLAAEGQRWDEAEALLRQALSFDDRLLDAYRALGEVLVKQDRPEEAITAYEHSLKLALVGHKPLEGPIVTYVEGNRLVDQDHSRVHARLARLYESKGTIAEAINGYRISIAGGCDGVGLRMRLGRLYLRQKQWRRGTGEAWQAVKMIPAALRKTGRRIFRRVRSVHREWISGTVRPGRAL